jgi:hypothetical protein
VFQLDERGVISKMFKIQKGVNRRVQSIQSGDPFDLREAVDWLELLSHQYSGLFLTTP